MSSRGSFRGIADVEKAVWKSDGSEVCPCSVLGRRECAFAWRTGKEDEGERKLILDIVGDTRQRELTEYKIERRA